MLPDIKKFYELTQNKEFSSSAESPEIPITFVHIFHKEYPRLESISLPSITASPTLDALFQKRVSSRTFSEAPLTLEQFSSVLHSCSILESQELFERRTYPSAGARFPIELYPISFTVEGLKKGAYHYNMRQRSLELLWERNLMNERQKFVSPYVKNPSAAIIMTSVISRSEIKYGYKSLPFSYIEAGHVGQNISLACAALNVGCCMIGGFQDETIKKVLDLTDEEIPVYAVGLGRIAS